MSKNRALIRKLGVVTLIVVLYFGNQYLDKQNTDTGSSETVKLPDGHQQSVTTGPPERALPGVRGAPNLAADDTDIIEQAFEARQSDVWVHAGGEVIRTLADDQEGSRHQRFLVRLRNDMTVLIAHNIDLAPRIPLRRGDTVEFRGEYEWNEKGGVIHWTHHDPRGRKQGGWIIHQRKKYE